MATQGPSLNAVLLLVKKMIDRARADFLPPTHALVVRARELHDAYEARFIIRPPDCSVTHYVDCYKRAYAAWHCHTGED